MTPPAGRSVAVTVAGIGPRLGQTSPFYRSSLWIKIVPLLTKTAMGALPVVDR